VHVVSSCLVGCAKPNHCRQLQNIAEFQKLGLVVKLGSICARPPALLDTPNLITADSCNTGQKATLVVKLKVFLRTLLPCWVLVGCVEPDHCRQLQNIAEFQKLGLVLKLESICARPPASLGACWVRQT